MKRSIGTMVWVALTMAGLWISLQPNPVPLGMLAAARIAAQNKQDEPYRAMQYYRKVWDYQPYDPEVYEKMGISALNAGEEDTAFAMLSEADRRKHLTDDGTVALATVLFHRKEYPLAEDLVLRIPRTRDAFDSAQVLLRNIYLQEKNWEKAATLLAHSESAAVYDPDLAQILSVFRDPETPVADLVVEHADARKALANFQAYPSQTDLQKADDWLRMGEYLQHSQQADLAEEAYRRAGELAPDAGTPWVLLALLRQQQGKDVSYELQQAMARSTGDAAVNFQLGYYWQQQGKPEVALVYLQVAYRLNPTDRKVLELLGKTELTLGNLQEGLDYLTEKAQVEESTAEDWMEIARYCLDQHIYLRERGLEAVRKAILLDEQNPQVFDLAGQIYWELGDELTAGKYFQKALKISADYPPAQLHLGLWYLHRNDSSQAVPLMQRAAAQSNDPETRAEAQQALKDAQN